MPEPGGDVVFTVVIDNTSSATDPVTITSLTDDVHGDLDGRGTCAVPQTIQPGDSYSCSFSAFVAGNAGDSETDVVTASGTDDDGSPVTDSDDATVTVSDLPSGIVVTKTADPETIFEPGSSVTFTFTVENTSIVDTVTITSLRDSVFGDLNGRGSCSTPQTLEPGAIYTCAYSSFIAGNAGESHLNVVTARGVDDDGDPVLGEDLALVSIIGARPSIVVAKTPSPSTVPEPGDTVTFMVEIFNRSVLTDPVTITSFVDDIHGDLNGQGTCTMPQTIQPQENYECSFTAFVAGDAGDAETDVVSATGTDDDGALVFGRDDATVIVTDVPSAIEVVKATSTDSVPEPGGEVTFTFTVTNLSAVDTVALNSLTDDTFGDLNGQGTCVLPQALDPGESYSCSLVSFIAGDTGDVHTNVVTADGVDDDGVGVTATDDASVTIAGVAPSITVDKTVDPVDVAEPGGQVAFTVTVENTSVSTDPVTLTSLVDDVHGDLDGRGTCALTQVILAGASYTCSFDATVTGNAGFVEVDTVTADGEDNDGASVTAQDDAEVSILNTTPQIVVVKTADPTVVLEPQGNVIFSLAVTNASVATDPLILTSLVDDVFGDVTDPLNPLLTSTTCELVVIDPGASYECEFVAPVNGEAGDVHTNVATVTSLDDEETEATASDDEDVDVVDVPSSVTISKDAAPSVIPETGGEVTFTITVTNTSPTDTLTLTGLVDDVFGDLSEACALSSALALAPGQSTTCSFTELLLGMPDVPHIDVVTASGFDDDGFGFAVSDDAEVTFTPVIDLETTIAVDPAAVTVGDTTMLTVTFTNQGPSPATGTEATVVLPGDLTYLGHMTVWSDVDRGHVVYDTATGGVMIGDLGVGESMQLIMTVLTMEPGAFTVPAEVIAADQPDLDSTPADGMGDDYAEATVSVAQVLASAVVGDTAFLDLDADGIEDEDDPGLSGVTVVLTNKDTGATASAVTNADGKYLFSALPAANYRVSVVVPEGLGLTTPGAFEFFLSDGESYLTADFGFQGILPRTGIEVGLMAVIGTILLAFGLATIGITRKPRTEGD